MRDISDQVARVTQELRDLLVQLHWSTFQSSSPTDQSRVLNELLNAGLVEDLRTAVDHLSHFLWSYIESTAGNSDPEADYELQNERLRRITEILRLLHRSARPSEDPLAFVDRIARSVDRHLKAHNQELQWEQSA